MSISADQMELPHFLLWCQDNGLPVVAAASLDRQLVSINLSDVEPLEVLQGVARRLNTDIQRVGSIYVLGTARPEDVAVLVRSVPRLQVDTAATALGALVQSGSGSVSVSPDGVVICTGTVELLARVDDVIAGLSSLAAVTWCVQVQVFSVSATGLKDLGLDAIPAVELAISLAEGSQLGNVVGQAVEALSADKSGVEVDGALRMLLRAEGRDNNVRSVAAPMLLVGEASEAVARRGGRIPYRLDVVGRTGAVGQQVQFIETGLTVRATCRDLGQDRGRLVLSFESNSSAGDVDGIPIINLRALDTSADVVDGGVYLLGAIDVNDDRSSRGQLLTWGKKHESERETWLLFAKVYRIGASLGVAPDNTEDAL